MSELDSHEIAETVIAERLNCTPHEASVLADVLLSHPSIFIPSRIAGTPSDVVAALEALPDGAIVRVSDEAKADRECAVFVAVQGFGGRTWEGSGVHGTFATSYLANNCTPLTVIA